MTLSRSGASSSSRCGASWCSSSTRCDGSTVLRCGVTVEVVPWATGKSSLTKAYAYFLASWAKRMSWSGRGQGVPHQLGERVPLGGDGRRVGPGAPQPRRHPGHRRRRGPLAEGPSSSPWSTRSTRAALGCSGSARTERRRRCSGSSGSSAASASAALQFVCSDMWKPYLKVIAKKATQAIHVLDRFHIMANMNKAIDEVRREGGQGTEGQGPRARSSRAPAGPCSSGRRTAPPSQDVKLADLRSLQSARRPSHLLREEFQLFWKYLSPFWAGYLPRPLVHAR